MDYTVRTRDCDEHNKPNVVQGFVTTRPTGVKIDLNNVERAIIWTRKRFEGVAKSATWLREPPFNWFLDHGLISDKPPVKGRGYWRQALDKPFNVIGRHMSLPEYVKIAAIQMKATRF